MSLHQPVPFEYKHGKLVDAFGETVLWRNKHNLAVIAEYMNKDINPDVGVILNEIEEKEGEEYEKGFIDGKQYSVSVIEEHLDDMELIETIRDRLK